MELNLIVTEKKEGVLLTNIDLLEKFVTDKLEEYTPEKYAGDADEAKKDRAVLNASKKTLTSERIKVIKELMKPFEDFEARCKKLEKNIDAAADALGEIVKVKEALEKAERRAIIDEYWRIKEFSLVSLDKIFDEKWLNKTAKLKDIKAEIDAKIEAIYSGIKTIEAFGVDVDTLKPLFLETLDIGRTIEQGNRIKENRARLEKEEAERKEREQKQVLQEAQKELIKEENQTARMSATENLASMALGEEPDPDPEMEFTLTFKARRSVLFALKQYMLDNKITYVKEIK